MTQYHLEPQISTKFDTLNSILNDLEENNQLLPPKNTKNELRTIEGLDSHSVSVRARETTNSKENKV